MGKSWDSGFYLTSCLHSYYLHQEFSSEGVSVAKRHKTNSVVQIKWNRDKLYHWCGALDTMKSQYHSVAEPQEYHSCAPPTGKERRFSLLFFKSYCLCFYITFRVLIFMYFILYHNGLCSLVLEKCYTNKVYDYHYNYSYYVGVLHLPGLSSRLLWRIQEGCPSQILFAYTNLYIKPKQVLSVSC